MLMSAESALHPGGEIKLTVCPKLQGLILSCCKSARFGITKTADLAT